MANSGGGGGTVGQFDGVSQNFDKNMAVFKIKQKKIIIIIETIHKLALKLFSK